MLRQYHVNLGRHLCFIFFVLFTECQAVDTCERDVQPFPFTKLVSEVRRHLDSLWLVKLPVHLEVFNILKRSVYNLSRYINKYFGWSKIKSTSESPNMRQSPREHWRYWPECLTTVSVKPIIRMRPNTIISPIWTVFEFSLLVGLPVFPLHVMYQVVHFGTPLSIFWLQWQLSVLGFTVPFVYACSR